MNKSQVFIFKIYIQKVVNQAQKQSGSRVTAVLVIIFMEVFGNFV